MLPEIPGLVPVLRDEGSTQAVPVDIDPDGANPICPNDPVTLAGGMIVRAAPGDTIYGVAQSLREKRGMPLSFWEPGNATPCMAVVYTDHEQEYRLYDPMGEQTIPETQGRYCDFQYDAVDVVREDHSTLTMAVPAQDAAGPALKIVRPLERLLNYRRFGEEATMLQYDPVSRLQGYQGVFSLYEFVWRTDLEAWFRCDNIQNLTMADWTEVTLPDGQDYPITTWIVRISHDQLEDNS